MQRPPAERRGGAVPAFLAGKALEGIEVTNREIDTVACPLPVRIYAPASADETLPGLLYSHGGGWVMGSVEPSNVL